MRKYLLMAVVCLASCLKGLSQPSPGAVIDSVRLDSLKKILPLLKDKKRVDMLYEIAMRTSYGGYEHREDSVKYYNQRAYDEATKIGYKSGIARGLIILSGRDGIMNRQTTDDATREKNIKKGIALAEEVNDLEVLGWGYYCLANIPAIQKDYKKHIEYDKKAMEHFIRSGHILFAAETANWICDQYLSRGEYEIAYDYSKKAVELSKISGTDICVTWHQFLVQYSIGNMAQLYSAAGDNETALNYTFEAHKFGTDQNTGWKMHGGIAALYCEMKKYDSALLYWSKWKSDVNFSNSAAGHRAWGNAILGRIHLANKQYDKAIKIFKTTTDTLKSLLSPYAAAEYIILTGQTYNELKLYSNALKYAKQGVKLSEAKNRRPIMMQGYQLLSSVYSHLGKKDSAYKYLVKYHEIKDSIQNRQFLLRIYNSKKNAEEERKTSQINLLNKDNQLKQQKLKQEATLKKGLIAGLILLPLLGIFIFRNLTLKRKTALEKQRLLSENKQAELEMQALRAQMNPHFIFNCLSSINRFILKNEGKTASSYLTRFSRLMRMVLMNSQKPLISLDDELQMLEIYLEMERLRFKNSFDYGITFLNAVDSDNIFIPPLLLQPFCENAIWHGLMNKEGQGRLDIELSMQDNILNCIITDNGVGRKKAEEMNSKTAEKEKSMGLKITTERLALLNKEKGLHTFYDIEDVLNEHGEVSGTRVQLKIMYKERVEETV